MGVRDLIQQGDFVAAASAAEEVCRDDTATLQDWLALGHLRLQLKRPEAALATFNHCTSLSPDEPQAANGAAHALCLLGRHDEALQRLQQQLLATPEHLETRVNCAYVTETLGHYSEAIEQYSAALEHSADDYRARFNRAGLLSRYARYDEALADYDVLVEQWPQNVPAWYNRGECLLKMRRFDEAAEDCGRAIHFAPNHVRAMMCRAVALACGGRISAAQALFESAWALDREVASAYGQHGENLAAVPDARALRVQHEFSRFNEADWSGYDNFVAAVAYCAVDTEAHYGALSIAFPTMYAPLDADSSASIHAAISRAIARDAVVSAITFTAGRERLRIGYLSSKFRASAAIVLMGGILAAHDRSRVEVFTYAVGIDDDSVERAMVRNDADCFVDLSALDDVAAAERIRRDHIDILIDLNGYSDETRPGILAQRVAPVQIEWLGHMHSLYAPWVDYRFADHIAEPEYGTLKPPEARIFLPPSFYSYDERRRPRKIDHRSALGLPNAAFVFCAFNTIAKLEPRVFKAWMEILARAEGAVLWLLDPGEIAKVNLLKVAAASGISALRLVFAPRRAHHVHMQRFGAADLYLDTFAHGAHTNALDALHAGVPMLTMAGDSLARRVGASLMTAVGLERLVVADIRSYIETATTLAANPDEMRALRTHLASRLDAANPFASAVLARRLERAFEIIIERVRSGLPPADFDLD